MSEGIVRCCGLVLLAGILVVAGSRPEPAFAQSAGGPTMTTNWTQMSGWFSTPPYPPEHRYTPGPAMAGGTQAAAAPAADDGRIFHAPRNAGLGGILSEVRLGILDHDFGLVSSATESGVDGNIEFLFTSPDFLSYILSPRPHLGASINSDGDTSQGYFGLTWTADIYDNFFVELSVGGAIHDGETDIQNEDAIEKNDLGCTLLFRESLSAGVIFFERHSISVMFDHISNAGFCGDNDGLDNLGVRYGYRF